MYEVVVTGATSIVARYLLPLLVARGVRVIAVSRRSRGDDVPASVEWRQADIAGPVEAWWRPGAWLVHLAPISLLADRLSELQALRGVTAFSTTSVITKASSPDPVERSMAANLRRAEERIVSAAASSGITTTVLRPTLIYDGLNDHNVARLRRFIHRYGFLPLAGPANGLRQPVHAADLADFCVTLLTETNKRADVMTTSGGETLAYREMVERIFAAVGRRPRIVHLPVAVLTVTAAGAKRLGLLRHVSPAFLSRMNEDLVFDNSQAIAAGFRPRPFLPEEAQ